MEELLRELLEHNANSIHPGGGKQNAQLIRKICVRMEWDEDEYLPRYVLKNKKEWGL